MMPHSKSTIHRSNGLGTADDTQLAEPLGLANAMAEDKLMNQFMRDFTFKVASTPEEVEKALSLRHEVFIQEIGYKMTEKGIDNKKLESDEYDKSAVHCILVQKSTGKTAGCFRIVTTRTPEHEGGYRKLPVEEHGNGGISHPTLHPSMLPRDHICEASRLAISKSFRVKSKNTGPQDCSHEPQEAEREPEEPHPLILVSLFLAAYSLAETLGHRHLYAMMAPTLPRLLKKSGFEFIRLGGTIDFHGKRNVFYINRSLAVSGMQHTLYPLHHYIYQELEAQVAEHSIHDKSLMLFDGEPKLSSGPG